MSRNTWTLAYRKPTANRFKRVTGVEMTWDGARKLARVAVNLHPEFQIYYVPTAEFEATCTAEDIGNILVDSGKRVRIAETGSLDELGLTAIDVRAADDVPAPVAETPAPSGWDVVTVDDPSDPTQTPDPAEIGPEKRSQGALNVPSAPRPGRKSHRNPNRRAQRKSQRAARRVNRTH